MTSKGCPAYLLFRVSPAFNPFVSLNFLLNFVVQEN